MLFLDIVWACLLLHLGRRIGGCGSRRRQGDAVDLRSDAGADILPPLLPSQEVAAECEQDGEEDEREGDDNDEAH
ncbi:unnamed protein product, partial [Musa acuminata subsp. burmannicoides]